ncbi:MAG: M28 family peptidase, partial [Chloroflexi bacterium]|nr:M28 family peptidase [Chloroflexota bacterium]
QVIPPLVAPRPTPDPAQQPLPTLSPTEEAGLTDQARAFDGAAALAHIQELCAPAYKGRWTGSPGAERAAAYIATRFQDYGLQPAGDDNTYWQIWTADIAYLTTTPALTMLSRPQSPTPAPTATATATPRPTPAPAWQHHQDFREVVGGWCGGGTAIGEVAYLGSAEAVDFAAIDVQGRVVLCHPVNVGLAAEQAANHGAAALLAIVRNPQDIQRRAGYRAWRRGEAIPCLLINPQVADRILRTAGRSLESAATVARPFRTSVSVRVEVPLATEPAAPLRNVLGLLPGTDPRRADQVIILGAHYDGLGQDPAGTLYPGAIDNASGVAVLLEIARLWHEQGFRPRVSVLFAAWDGQMPGLLGSSYYVAHPRYPLPDTVAAIQLDSVGGGPGDLLAVAPGSPRLHDALFDNTQRLGLRLGLISEEVSSDHVPFINSQVPAVVVMWADSWVVTHIPADAPGLVRVEALYQTGAIVDLTLMHLALKEE